MSADCLAFYFDPSLPRLLLHNNAQHCEVCRLHNKPTILQMSGVCPVQCLSCSAMSQITMCLILTPAAIAAVWCLQRRRDFRQNIQSVFVQLGCGAHAISRRDIQNVTKGVLWARKGRNPAVETGCFCAKRIVLSGGWLRWFDVCWTCNKKADGERGLDRGAGSFLIQLCLDGPVPRPHLQPMHLP